MRKPDRTTFVTGQWKSVMITTDETGQRFYNDRGEVTEFTVDQAIQVAMNTLLTYDVPFCHRVKGAGLESSDDARSQEDVPAPGHGDRHACP
jgi:hypothetical protein